jgi:hypothetical protein
MKLKFIIGLVASILCTGPVFASSGSATIANWISWSNSTGKHYNRTAIYVNNVSNSTVTVTFTAFNQTANSIVSSGFESTLGNGGSFTNCNSAGTQCDLAPKTGGTFALSPLTNIAQEFGSGTISWTSDDTIPVALTSLVRIQKVKVGTGVQSEYSALLNSGNPF